MIPPRRATMGKVAEEAILLVAVLAFGLFSLVDWLEQHVYADTYSKALAVAASLAVEKMTDLRLANNTLASNAGGELLAGLVVRSGVEYVRSWTVVEGGRSLEKKVSVSMVWMDSQGERHDYSLDGVVKSRSAQRGEVYASVADYVTVPAGLPTEELTIGGRIGRKSLTGVQVGASGDGQCQLDVSSMRYTCRVKKHFTGVVLPFKHGIGFSPREHLFINLDTDRNNQDFKAG